MVRREYGTASAPPVFPIPYSLLATRYSLFATTYDPRRSNRLVKLPERRPHQVEMRLDGNRRVLLHVAHLQGGLDHQPAAREPARHEAIEQLRHRRLGGDQLRQHDRVLDGDAGAGGEMRRGGM